MAYAGSGIVQDELDVDDPTSTDGTIAILGDGNALDAPGTSTGSWDVNLAQDILSDPGGGIQTNSNGTTLPGAIANYSESGMTIAAAQKYFTNYVATAPGLRDLVLEVGTNDLAALPQTTSVSTELPILTGEVSSLVSSLQGSVRVELVTIPPDQRRA